MANPKGSLLYVNLGASQTRRRLKSFGHGVRKVQAAGKNQAVIIHTATGRHLEELTAKFADVGFSHRASDLQEPIENLRNLGPTSGQWLRAVGIATIADLERFGAVEAYRLVKHQQSRASLNLLWAMVAGLKDIDWRELSERHKQELLAALSEE